MHGFYSKFLRSVEQWPQNVAVEMQHAGSGSIESYTYAQLRTMAESVGQWLVHAGLPAGSRCAILAGNSPHWVAAYLGTLASGHIAVPLDTALKPEQSAKLLRDSGATLLFTDARNFHNAQTASQGLPIRLIALDNVEWVQLPSLSWMMEQGPGDFAAAVVEDDNVAVLLYTSGTTSDPKGVMLTHSNLMAEEKAVTEVVDVGPTDSILGVLPLFHALAQMANLLLPFAFGARVVYLETLNTTELLRALRERRVTLFACVPQFFYLIHEKVMRQIAERGSLEQSGFRMLMKLSGILRRFGINAGPVFFRPVHQLLGPAMRYMVTGGSRFDPAVCRDLHDLGFNMLQAYGLTETSGAAFVTPPKSNVLGSVGKPLPGSETKIIEAIAHEPNEPASGEILVRGGIVMPGYYNRPQATAEVLKDGWLHTGDLGYLDARGNLFITGRKKDIIVLSNGKNIYPEEIEAHYLKSPFIKEICVLGLQSRPGEPISERLHAVVVPDFDVLRERRIVNAKEVIRFDIEGLSAQMPSVKRVLSYDIWQQELPRTTTRKLKRHEILKRVVAQQSTAAATTGETSAELSSDDAVWMADADVTRALELIGAAAKKKTGPIRPSQNLELDLGLDSMERVELLVSLESELGAHVDESVISEVYTVRELVDAVMAARGATGTRTGFAGWDAVLATETEDPEVQAVMERRPISARAWYIGGKLVNLFTQDAFGLRIEGLEKLPDSGSFILCPNHQSFLDAPFVIAALPWPIFKKLFYVGTSEIFGSGFMRRVARTLKLVPVDPDANLVNAMRAGAYGLRRGKILVLYPEGERSIDGPPKTFKKGAAILSMHLKVPIYPVALDGFFDAWPRGKPFQGFKRLRIRIGDPILPPGDLSNPEKKYAQLTTELRERVLEMWEDLHRELHPEEKRAAAAKARAATAAAD